MARKRKDKKKQQPQKKKITAESNKNKELRDKILKNKADTFKIVTLGDGTVGRQPYEQDLWDRVSKNYTI